MTENFNRYQPNGEPAEDRWLTAVHLFDEPDARDEAELADTWMRMADAFQP